MEKRGLAPFLLCLEINLTPSLLPSLLRLRVARIFATVSADRAGQITTKVSRPTHAD
jgi:hypothetical protein